MATNISYDTLVQRQRIKLARQEAAVAETKLHIEALEKLAQQAKK